MPDLMTYSECPRLGSSWTQFTHAVSRLLLAPLPLHVRGLIVFIACAIAVWLIRLIYRHWKTGSHPHWSPTWTRLTIGAALTAMILLSPPALDAALWGLSYNIPPDPGTPADAIVFPGRPYRLDNGGRFDAAAQLWKEGRAPLIFVSGSGTTPFEIMAQIGVPPSAMSGEVCSLTTNENAIYSAYSLKPRGIRRIILITDPPHMRRSILSYENQGFEVIPHMTTLIGHLGYRERIVLVLREYGGLLSYLLLGRFDTVI
jgi:uncharacterized SAM-binding protein YcdF (DUF218 family)